MTRQLLIRFPLSFAGSPLELSAPTSVKFLRALQAAHLSVYAGFMRTLLCLSALAGLLGATATSLAAPPASGLYEDWSPVTRRPVGRLSQAPSPRLLPRWLHVTTHADTSVLKFLPDGRTTWTVKWGPHGVTQKVTHVDGKAWTQSTFTYSKSGRLVSKDVSGPGLGLPTRRITSTYIHDSQGRVARRRGRVFARGGKAKTATLTEALKVIRKSSGLITVETTVDGRHVRRDTFDAAGRRLKSEFGTGSSIATLRYKRDKHGRLRRIDRQLSGAPTFARATPQRRTQHLTATHLKPFIEARVERHEVLLALGSPANHSDDGRGLRRVLSDNYSAKCWLNRTSTLEYDASGLLRTKAQGCICGFCVAATLAVQTPERHIEGTDLHWTAGPWIRLNGRVDVTADHFVVTTTGEVPAGLLVPGDVLIGSNWGTVVLRTVERLQRGPERLGRNVRTTDGYFGAGGILFVSESACPM